MELYFKLSTTQFELMFYPPKQQMKILHQVTRPETRQNRMMGYFINELRFCKECIKEDIEQFGEAYVHRSHQLSGVCACHKHHTKLYEVKKLKERQVNYKQTYDFENLTEKVDVLTDYDIKYAKYAHELMKQNICTCADDISSILFDKIRENNKYLTKEDCIKRILSILENSSNKDKWEKANSILPVQDVIKILMELFPNVNDFIKQLKPYNLILKKYCKKCNKYYYTTEYAIKNGYSCSYCDNLLSELKLHKRLIHTITKGEYELLEFNGIGYSATFRHNICGQEFSVNFFRDFIETPKCRCCEIPKDITQEIFEQEVKDVVGDEYTVISQVKTRDDKVKIKHNKCGHIMNVKVFDFLDGSRCPHCYCKASVGRIKQMLVEYADDRYTIIGHDKYRTILYDNETKKEIQLRNKRIVQEMLRPTPSPILPTHKQSRIKKQLTTWDMWYQLCIEYKDEFGHLCPQHNENYKTHSIGDWCSQQRIAYNKGILSEEKIQKLKDIGFVFDAILYYWNKRFEEYKEYVKETGNKLPKTDEIYEGKKVGTWVNTQRKQRNRGKLPLKFEKLLLEFNPNFFDARK